MVESVACRPPIRPPRSRRSSGWSSPGWSPRWRPSWATSGWPRTWPRTRWSTRCASGPATAPRGTPVPGSPPWANARRSTSSAATARLSEKYAQLGAELEQAVARPADEDVDFDPESQEEIADDRLRLMFVSCHPVLSRARPDGAHAAPGRWPHGARDRPGLRGAGADDRATHRPGQEDDRRGRRSLRGPDGSGPGGPAGIGAPGDLPHLQRGVLGHLRGGLAAARALCAKRSGSAGCSPPWRRKSPRSLASSP